MIRHPAADADCPRCHGSGFQVHRGAVLAEASACACVGRCPVCRDTGFVATSDAFRAPRKRCVCQVLVRRIAAFNEVGIPARHAESSLVSYVPNKQRMKWFTPVNRYILDYRAGEVNPGLVLHGDVGRGKTHLMVAILRELVFRYGVTCRFVEFSHLLADLKSGFDRGVGSAALIDPLTRVQVLAIDELGKGRNTEFEGTVLDELISRRYNLAATVLGTTNYAPRAPSRAEADRRAETGFTTASDTLVDRVGPRVFSRLQEMCDFVEVGGEDYRVALGRSARR